MSGRTPPSYDHRLSVNITRQMYDRLAQIASTRDEPFSEVAREAFRLYLDQQEDLIASRKHFTRSFQRRLDHTDWQLSVLIQLVSFLTSQVMTVFNEQAIAPESVFQFMLERAEEDDWQDALHNARAKERRKVAEKPTAS
jgi:predicted DNA-binding protein